MTHFNAHGNCSSGWFVFLYHNAMDDPISDITRILGAMERGDTSAADELLAAVYVELRRLARSKMAREAPGHTLQATALVHEAWLRLGVDGNRWQNRAHFFGAAAEAMRRILIESARRKQASRHGGLQQRVNADHVDLAIGPPDEELLAVHDALDKLARHDAQKAELVKLRYFVGLTMAEAADILGISVPTAKRHWAFARAWLYQEIKRF